MVVLTAANIAPLLELKDKSVKADDEEGLDLDDDEELEALYAGRFKGKELDLVVWAMKKLLGCFIEKATEIVAQARDRLFSFAKKLVEVPLLTVVTGSAETNEPNHSPTGTDKTGRVSIKAGRR